MTQLIAVAIGGAFGAVFRFLLSNGVYQWLGRDFPYGTLTVNILGSFLMGLLTEALLLQRIAISMEFRSAILVGVFGALTTFSTFSLETLYLIEQGSVSKALANVLLNVFYCVFAVWLGLLISRSLFLYSGGIVRWMGWTLPYALIVINTIGAFLIGLVTTTLMQKLDISMEYKASLLVVLLGLYLTFSGLYLILYFIENGLTLKSDFNAMLGVFLINTLAGISAVWLGLWASKQI